METTSPLQATKHVRGPLLNEEQSLCLEALESGAYDDMSDQEWVALCERLAADSRHHEDDTLAADEAIHVTAELVKPRRK